MKCLEKEKYGNFNGDFIRHSDERAGRLEHGRNRKKQCLGGGGIGAADGISGVRRRLVDEWQTAGVGSSAGRTKIYAAGRCAWRVHYLYRDSGDGGARPGKSSAFAFKDFRFKA